MLKTTISGRFELQINQTIHQAIKKQYLVWFFRVLGTLCSGY